jgi:hypothetical protein
MADFDDLILSITGRLQHEFDFAFTKNNGDLANHLRSKFKPEEESAVRITAVTVDEDGDIRVRTEKATCYLSASAITVAGWLTSAKTLWGERGLDQLGETMECLFAERHAFQSRDYDIRLFVYARKVSDDDVDAVLSRSCGVALQSMFTQGIPHRLRGGRMFAEYQKDKFSDTLEFESLQNDVELRYIRAGKAQDFGSYRQFLRSADLNGLVEYIKPFAELFRKHLPAR